MNTKYDYEIYLIKEKVQIRKNIQLEEFEHERKMVVDSLL